MEDWVPAFPVPFREIKPLSPVKALSSSYSEVPVTFSSRLVNLAARHCHLVSKDKEKLNVWLREVFGLKVDRRVVELKKALSLKIPSTKWIVTANLSSLLETVNWTLLAEGYKRIRCRSGKNIDEVIDRVIEVFKKMVKMLENVTTGEKVEVVTDLEDSLAAWEETLVEAETAGKSVLRMDKEVAVIEDILNTLKLAFSVTAKYCEDICPFPLNLFGNDWVFSHSNQSLPVPPTIYNINGLPTPPSSDATFSPRTHCKEDSRWTLGSGSKGSVRSHGEDQHLQQQHKSDVDLQENESLQKLSAAMNGMGRGCHVGRERYIGRRIGSGRGCNIGRGRLLEENCANCSPVKGSHELVSSRSDSFDKISGKNNVVDFSFESVHNDGTNTENLQFAGKNCDNILVQNITVEKECVHSVMGEEEGCSSHIEVNSSSWTTLEELTLEGTPPPSDSIPPVACSTQMKISSVSFYNENTSSGSEDNWILGGGRNSENNNVVDLGFESVHNVGSKTDDLQITGENFDNILVQNEEYLNITVEGVMREDESCSSHIEMNSSSRTTMEGITVNGTSPPSVCLTDAIPPVGCSTPRKMSSGTFSSQNTSSASEDNWIFGGGH